MAITGIDTSPYSDWATRIYRNEGDGMFSHMAVDIPNVTYGSVAWVDVDNDGDLDLSLEGSASSVSLVRIYRNTNGVFSEMPSFSGLTASTLKWGDYDNDGDPDLALTGTEGTKRVTKVFRNDGNGVFTDSGSVLHGVYAGSFAWGDYNGDGRLDLALSGEDDSGTLVTKIYRNTTPTPNTPPSAPTGLTASLSGHSVLISWNPASDAETPSAGLSYNIRIGTTSGGSDICSGMASADGVRRLPQSGMAKACLWKLNLVPGTYYYSVQAIDTAFAGSPWSAETQITVPDNPVSPMEAKSAADDTLVSVNGCAVTGIFGDDFYIERTDRSSGIRVHRPGHQQYAGNLVDVAGIVATDPNGERYINAGKAVCVGGRIVAPLCLNNRAFGGGTTGLQTGMPDSFGLNNIGLLVKVAGKFRVVDSSSFTIDDGSGPRVKCVLPTGVKMNYAWGHVSATGVASYEKSYNSFQRLVKIRSQSDLQAFSGADARVWGTIYDTGSGAFVVDTNVESPHPYPNNYINTWQISAPAGAKRMRLHLSTFNVYYNDFLLLLDGAGNIVQNFRSGSSIIPFWTSWVTGNTATLKLITDAAFQANGFVVDKYEYEIYNPLPGVQVTLMPGNYSGTSSATGTFSIYAPPGTYTLTPSFEGSTFSPANRTVTLDYGQYLQGLDFTKQ